eukprot:11807177-Alexandrium_andersonii.AAC.1
MAIDLLAEPVPQPLHVPHQPRVERRAWTRVHPEARPQVQDECPLHARQELVGDLRRPVAL